MSGREARSGPPLGRLVLCAAFLLLPVAAAAQTPSREISMLPTEVKDTFFAYVLGIVRAGVDVDIDNASMRRILTEFKSTLNLPFDLITRVTQHTVAGERTIGIQFSRMVSIPIPFSLLFYHPGSIVAAQDVSFRVTTASGPVLILTLDRGTILVDVDDWLEVLFRAYIEDTWIEHLVFFTWHGDWVGMLEGSGRTTRRQIRAFFNFTRNAIIFPTPQALDALGKSYLP